MSKIFTQIFFGLLIFLPVYATAQDSVWTLTRCINYAKENNISIQESALNEKVAKMLWEQGRLSVLPSVSVAPSIGKSFGRSINPTTNEFQNATYDYAGFGGSANVLLFGWFQKWNTNKKNALQYQAAQADADQQKDDVVLNVVTGYLRILLAKAQIGIAESQMQVSQKQVGQTNELLKGGRSNGLDLSQVKAQAAIDSANYFKTLLDYRHAIIDLKAILNLNLADAFVPKEIEPGNIPLDNTLDLDPEEIYSIAAKHFGIIRSDSLKIESAKKNVAIARGNLYPQLSFGVTAGTNYSSSYFEYLPDGQAQLMPFGKQFQNNFSQSLSLGLNIPLFNGLASQYAVRQAKVNVKNSILQKQDAEMKLKQAVYNACGDAQTSLQTYRAAKSALDNAVTGSDFAQKRYDKGLISAIELLTAQSTTFKSKTGAAAAEYDLVFKLLMIDYYLGKEIRLKD